MFVYFLGLMSYALRILEQVTGGDNNAICQLSKLEFVNLCAEVVKRPNFNEFSLKFEKDAQDCELRNMSADSEDETQEIEEFYVRLCPTKPELYLADGDETYTAIAYEFIIGRFIRIKQLKNLAALGYEEEKDEDEEETAEEEKDGTYLKMIDLYRLNSRYYLTMREKIVWLNKNTQR